MWNIYYLQIVWNHVSNSVGQIAEKCRPFVNKCVQYCWLMCIQDPPIHMSTFNRGEEYNSNEMKSFTKTGRFVDFVVWPAFYLYENGPLLSKAIIQGTNQFSQGQGKDQYRRRDNVEISNKHIRGAQITQPHRTGTPNEYSPQNIIDRANPRTLTHEREMRPMDGMPSIESTERNGNQNDQNFTHVPSKSGEYRPIYSPNPHHEKRREPPRERTNNYQKAGIPATVYRDTQWYANSPHGTSQNHHSAISQQTGQRSTNAYQVEQYIKHSETASRSNYYRQGHHQPFSKTYTEGSRTYKSTEL